MLPMPEHPAPLALAVAGAAGRMGRAVIESVAAAPEIKLVAAIEKEGAKTGAEAVSGISYQSAAEANWQAFDVVIDFSAPLATVEHAQQAAAADCPLVVGTTGLNQDQFRQLESAALRIPVLIAPNMSFGVNVLFALVAKAAELLPDWDAEVLELHHRSKIDAPSGTAMRLAELLQVPGGPAKPLCLDRTVRRRARPAGEIGMAVMRAGEAVGEHTVLLAGPGERLELTHRASDRRNFAIGAVRAAQFLVKRQPGLYHITDVLGLT